MIDRVSETTVAARETTTGARAYFAEVREHDIEELPPIILRRIVAEMLRQGGLLLDLAGDLWYPEPAEGSEKARLAADLLAEVPGSQRGSEENRHRDVAAGAASLLAAMPGDLALTVTHWLRAARRDALTAAQRDVLSMVLRGATAAIEALARELDIEASG